MSVYLSIWVFVYLGVWGIGCLCVGVGLGDWVSVCLGEWVSECMCVGVSMYLEVCGSARLGIR